MNFQSYIHGKNHWLLDPDLKPILQSYWRAFPQHEEKLAARNACRGIIECDLDERDTGGLRPGSEQDHRLDDGEFIFLDLLRRSD